MAAEDQYPTTVSYSGGSYGIDASRNQQPFRGIVIHVTGKPTLQSEMDYMSKQDPNRPGQYGYHYLIDKDGGIYQTAPYVVRTNHIMPNSQYGLSNNNALGIAFVGGDKGMTDAQIAAGKQLVPQLQSRFNIPSNMVVSHGMLDPGTRGPGHGLGIDNSAEGQQFITAFNSGQPQPAKPAAQPQGGGFNLANNMFGYLTGQGVSPQAARGAIISMMGESGRGLDPTSYNPNDPGGSIGFGQWNGPRRTALEAMAKAQGKPVTDPQLQFDYWKSELEGSESKSLDALKNAKSAAEGTNIWTSQYERPAVNNWVQRFTGNANAVTIGDNGALNISGAPTQTASAAPASTGTTPPSGTTGTTGTTPPSGTTGTTGTTQPDQPKSTLDILTGKTGEKKDQPSPIEQMGSALGIPGFGGQKQTQQSQAPQMQFQAPPARNVGMLEGAGPSLMAQVQANAAKPLTWGSQPGQAGGMQQAGPAGQAMGTTLNSMPQMPGEYGWGYYGSPMGFSGFGGFA